ncbi:MAG: hypothetical protein Q7J44_13105 [Pseudotabrizicola sp.]|uniref:hypothetical protein n=1 Tax=Pseudotabrizicola sp. TaxID=2939647 RepID=UPI002721081B|nr:hypothetical protein [Pseudotabrizicola sp.]MDO9639469.1 hypothetical protein [Pseudotabrizicola sp.]
MSEKSWRRERIELCGRLLAHYREESDSFSDFDGVIGDEVMEKASRISKADLIADMERKMEKLKYFDAFAQRFLS